MAKRVNIKQLKEESDGIIYYIVPNAKSLLKAGYIYCDYLMKKEDIDSVYEDLLIDYSVFGNELDVMIGYCKQTKEAYDSFINKYCQEFNKTNEEIQKQIKESVKITENDKGKNTSSYQTVLYHGNIFKCRQTEFKEYFIESANNIGCVLKFVKYSKEEVKETKKDSKPKNVRKKQKETKEDVKKDVKDNVINKKEKELDNKANENKPDDKVKEDIKVDLVKGKTTKSKVSRKPKQIIDDDLITDEPTGGTVKEVKEDKEVVKDEKNEIKKVKETKQKPSDQPKKVSLSHKPIGLDDELIDDNDEVEDDGDFEEINNAPTLNC